MSDFTNSSPALIYMFVVTVSGSIISAIHFGQAMVASLSPRSRLQQVEEALNRLQSLIDTSGEFLEGRLPWARSETLRLRLGLEGARNHTSNLDVMQWVNPCAFSEMLSDVKSVQTDVQTLIEENYRAKHPNNQATSPSHPNHHRFVSVRTQPILDGTV